MIATVPFGLFWFALGHFSSGVIKEMWQRTISPIILLLAAGILAMMLSINTDFTTKPDIRTARMGSWLLFPRSVCGVSAVLLLARLVPKHIGRPLSFIGRNSIVFFSLEFATFPFVSKVLSVIITRYNHLRLAEQTPLWQSLLAVLAQLAVLSAISPVVLRLQSVFLRLVKRKCLRPPSVLPMVTRGEENAHK